MTIRKTSDIGSLAIRSKSRKVSDYHSPSVRKIIKDLTDTMRKENLVGISAPQIGINERIFLSEIRNTTYRKNIAKEDNLRVFINPEIISQSTKKIEGYEGCGSVASAGLFGPVKRHVSIKVRAFDEKGEKFELEAKGFLARIIQHEIDHLNGIVFIDRVTDTKKLLGREEYIKKQGKK